MIEYMKISQLTTHLLISTKSLILYVSFESNTTLLNIIPAVSLLTPLNPPILHPLLQPLPELSH